MQITAGFSIFITEVKQTIKYIMTKERYQKIVAMLRRRQPDLTVIMEGVHKAHNLAAIARSCDAVGISDVHAITSKKELGIKKGVAMGSNRWLDMHLHVSMAEIATSLKNRGFQIIAADFNERALDYRQPDYTRPTALVVGQELFGVSEETLALADQSVFIPMKGMVQSLNVSVATAVVLYEAHNQREKAGMYGRSPEDERAFARVVFEKCYPRLAEQYRRRGEAYPELDDEGKIVQQA